MREASQKALGAIRRVRDSVAWRVLAPGEPLRELLGEGWKSPPARPPPSLALGGEIDVDPNRRPRRNDRVARWTCVAAIVIVAMSASAGCSETQQVEPSTRSTTTMQDTVRRSPTPDGRAGARVFASTCKMCHTVNIRRWIDDRVSLAALRPSYSTTVDKVTNGGVAMPAFRGKLSKQDIVNVAAFVSVVASRRGTRARGKTALDYLRAYRAAQRAEGG